MDDNADDSRLVNWRWVVIGVGIAILVSISTVTSTWSRISPENQQNIALWAYSLSVLWSYISWVAIAVFANFCRRKLPLFSEKVNGWFFIHLGISALIGFVHLLTDTLSLWWVFSGDFSFFAAYLEKLLRWMPVEILAYWACLGIFTVVANRARTRLEATVSYLQKMPIKFEDETILLDVADIDYIQAYDNYIFVYCGDKRYMNKASLTKTEQILDPKIFTRVHRTTLVNLSKVISVKHTEKNQISLLLANTKIVSVSRRKKTEVLKQIEHLALRSQSMAQFRKRRLGFNPL